jgi:hypothetical protein
VQVGHRQEIGGHSGKITIPRRELVEAVNSVRLARRVKVSLKLTIEKVGYFTDLSAVLMMLKMEYGKFNEFMRAQMREVKVKQQG